MNNTEFYTELDKRQKHIKNTQALMTIKSILENPQTTKTQNTDGGITIECEGIKFKCSSQTYKDVLEKT